MKAPGQAETDQSNAAFWSELCGTSIARQLGLTGEEPDALERYDEFYFAYYRYLKKYVDQYDLRGRSVLEIGLGYGTLGQYLTACGSIYYGLDIAATPVEMMRERLRIIGAPADDRILIGSALESPFPDETFDYVLSIGCLHHTGDLQRALEEVHRVLRPQGTAVVMLYNRYSLRQLWRVDRLRLATAIKRRGRSNSDRTVRGLYDANFAGEPAPHTDFVSRREVRRLMRGFSDVKVEAENLPDIGRHGKIVIPRERFLGGPIARLFGLDLYITATKAATGG
ncbi:MAG: class I SAM-dependent methyltransferase [Solirubrobacteraceae bacterium]